VLAVGIPLLLVYAAMLAIMIGQLRERTHARLEEQIERLAINWAARIDDRFRLAARGAEMARDMLLPNEEQQYELLEQVVASDPMIDGAKLVIPPMAIQVLRADEAFVRQQMETDALNVMAEGWTEPYSDELAEGRPTCSYLLQLHPEGFLSVDLALESIPGELSWLDLEESIFGIVSAEGRHVGKSSRGSGNPGWRAPHVVG